MARKSHPPRHRASCGQGYRRFDQSVEIRRTSSNPLKWVKDPMTNPPDFRSLLSQGKHALSVGKVKEICELIADNPRLATRLIEHIWDDDPGVAQRAADVLERGSHKPSPTLARILADSKEALLGLLPEAALKKTRWNLALTIGRLPLTIQEARRAAGVLESWLQDESSIMKTAALHGLADLTRWDSSLRPEVIDLLQIHERSGTPAMRARSRLLLAQFEKADKMAKTR